MDGINRVKLARWYSRRALLMLKCGGADRGNEWFLKAAARYFESAREQMRLARVALGVVKMRGYWVTECGQKSVLVYAGSPDEAVGVAACSGDWYGDAIDSATIEPSVRPMTHIKPSVIAWVSDMDLVV